MIGDTITVAVNAVNKVLNKTNQDSYGADYFLRESDAEYTLSVRHTIPKGSQTVESHMVRLDVVDIVDGVRKPPVSVWISFKQDGPTDMTTFGYRIAGLVDLLDDATLVGKLLGRQS